MSKATLSATSDARWIDLDTRALGDVLTPVVLSNGKAAFFPPGNDLRLSCPANMVGMMKSAFAQIDQLWHLRTAVVSSNIEMDNCNAFEQMYELCD